MEKSKMADPVTQSLSPPVPQSPSLLGRARERLLRREAAKAAKHAFSTVSHFASVVLSFASGDCRGDGYGGIAAAHELRYKVIVNLEFAMSPMSRGCGLGYVLA